MASQPLQLIQNPKTSKDWKNNKLYYMNKGFSKAQLERVEQNNKFTLIAQQVIAVRSKGGGSNPLDGGSAPRIKHKKVCKHPISNPTPPPSPVVNEIEDTKTRILSFSNPLSDDWDCESDV